MKIAGIIAEYNPFHNGHAYQIEQTKIQTGADFIIVVMSGNFVQRGTPALANCHLRAKMALLSGADLVLQLPSAGAFSSAETFARCGVSLLQQLNIVDVLSFGVETTHTDELTTLAHLFSEEPEYYRHRLSSYIKEGFSFPTARSKAATDYLSATQTLFPDSAAEKQIAPSSSDTKEASSSMLELLAQPNNILAIEYLRALSELHSDMTPCFITRQETGYHDKSLATPIASATAIRERLFSGAFPAGSTFDTPAFAESTFHAPVFAKSTFDASVSTGSTFDAPAFAGDSSLLEFLSTHIPPAAARALAKHSASRAFLSENNFSNLLQYKLILERGRYDRFAECPTELGQRIENHLDQFSDFSGFCSLLKTKNRTYTAISRALTHILTDYTEDIFDAFKKTHYAPYARVLGFRRDAAPLLGQLKYASIPVLKKLAQDQLLLTETQRTCLDLDLRCSQIYNAVLAQTCGYQEKNEYSQPLIFI